MQYYHRLVRFPIFLTIHVGNTKLL